MNLTKDENSSFSVSKKPLTIENVNCLHKILLHSNYIIFGQFPDVFLG